MDLPNGAQKRGSPLTLCFLASSLRKNVYSTFSFVKYSIDFCGCPDIDITCLRRAWTKVTGGVSSNITPWKEGMITSLCASVNPFCSIPALITSEVMTCILTAQIEAQFPRQWLEPSTFTVRRQILPYLAHKDRPTRKG